MESSVVRRYSAVECPSMSETQDSKADDASPRLGGRKQELAYKVTSLRWPCLVCVVENRRKAGPEHNGSTPDFIFSAKKDAMCSTHCTYSNAWPTLSLIG